MMKNDVLIKKVNEINGLECYTDYLVTSRGEIFSLRSNKKIETVKEYKQVTLHGFDGELNKISKCVAIHILVAKAFLRQEEGKNEVDHINRNKMDNRLENLRWVNRQENMDNRKVATKERLKRRKVLILHIESRQAFQFDSLSVACRELDLNYSCAYAAMVGNKKSTRGYRIFDAA